MSGRERELEQSPRWDELKDTIGRIEGDYIKQGFPNTGPLDTTEYMVLHYFGDRVKARVDHSRQYSAEGRQWRVLEGTPLFPPGYALGQADVAAWCELPQKES